MTGVMSVRGILMPIVWPLVRFTINLPHFKSTSLPCQIDSLSQQLSSLKKTWRGIFE